MKMRITVLAALMAVTPQIRATVNRALRPDDFEIVWAADASEAVEASAMRRPDLVLLDLDQRLESSRGNLESLRAANPNAPVILIAEPGAKLGRDLGEGKMAIVEKPFGATMLSNAVNALLDSATSLDSEKFRQDLLTRRDAPLALPPSYRHWGINE